MPTTFVDIQTVASPNFALALIEFESEALGTVDLGRQAVAEIVFDTTIANNQAISEIVFETSALGSIDGSPTIYGSAEAVIDFETEAVGSRVIWGYAEATIEFEGEAEMGSITTPESFSLGFMFDVAGASRPFGNVGNYIYDLPRFRVNL